MAWSARRLQTAVTVEFGRRVSAGRCPYRDSFPDPPSRLVSLGLPYVTSSLVRHGGVRWLEAGVEFADFFRRQRQRNRRHVLFQMGNPERARDRQDDRAVLQQP